MEILFVTWDKIDSQTGGGVVSYNELESLKQLGNVTFINPPMTANPFEADQIALNEYLSNGKKYDLAHFYSSTFSSLIKALKSDGTKITYTAAAHDIQKSQEEHHLHNIEFNLPHLTDVVLFQKYIQGYLDADVIICPSTHSAEIMSTYGCKNIKVIPHGTYLPKNTTFPKFCVGYLGSTGPDKGVDYLLQAWSHLNYPDALLRIGGKNSYSLIDKVRNYKGSIFLTGYLMDVEDFYNQISVYVQPSITEGFGIEVIEAMAYKKAVIVSTGAGAKDCITHGVDGLIFPAKDFKALASAIDYYKNNQQEMLKHSMFAGQNVKKYLWTNIQQEYKKVWNELLATI